MLGGRFPSRALLRRELIASLRKGSTFALVASAVLICTVLVCMNWPSAEAIRTQAGNVSQAMLRSLVLTLFTTCALFLPGLAGAAIVGEKEQETFDQLHMTLIRPGGIVLGKLINTLGLTVLLAVSILPVIGVVFFLVGINWQDLLRAATGVTLVSIVCCAAGLMCSIYFRTTVTAVLASYLCAAVVLGGPGLMLSRSLPMVRYFHMSIHEAPDWKFQDRLRRVELRAREVAALTSPQVYLNASPTPGALAKTSLYYSVLGGMLLIVSLRMLRRPPKPPRVEQAKPIDSMEMLEARRKRFPYFLIDPLKRKSVIEDGRNPMLVKECRWGMLGRLTVLVRFFYGGLVCFLLLTTVSVSFNTRFGETGYSSSVLWMMVVCGLLAPAISANALTKERELGNLDMLRMTLLSPREILLGKLAAAALSLAPLVLAAFAVVLSLGIIETVQTGLLFGLLLVVCGSLSLNACVALSLALAMQAALMARRSGGAVLAAYGLWLLVFAGPWVLVDYFGFYRASFGDTPGSPGSFESEISGIVSPFRAFMGLFDVTSLWAPLGVWVLNLGTMVCLGAALLYFSAQRLEKWVSRP